MTSAVDIVLVAFSALTAEEQEEAFARLSQARLQQLASGGGAVGAALESLTRAREHLDPEALTSTGYRRAWRELKQSGEEVMNLHTPFAAPAIRGRS